MYYPDEIVEEVRSRTDIVDVISSYVKLKRQGSTYFGLCPFHSEKSPSFSVTPSKQMYYCFGCHAGGNAITFVMQYENMTFPEALKVLADRAGVKLPEQEYSPEQKRVRDERMAILDVNKMAAAYYYYQLRAPQGEQGMQYFKDRQLSDETMHAFGLGYAGKYSDQLYKYMKSKGMSDNLLRESGLFGYDEKRGMYDKFFNRVMFPIMDVNNRVIGFGGRVMGDGKPKYLNSPETKVFEKSRNLFGLNVARKTRRPYLILCEGYMDVISMHQAGFTNAVASLGTALTSQHCSLLRRYTQNVILSYDSDDAGVNAALRAIPMLREAGITPRILDLKPYKDPDEFIKALGTEAFEQRLNHAGNSFFFETNVISRNYNMQDPDSRTKFLKEVAQKISRFELETERENYIQAAAKEYTTTVEGLREMVKKELMIQSGITIKPKLRRLNEDKKPKDEGLLQSQRLLLTWAVEYPAFYSTLSKYIKPEDFTTPFYQQIAKLLYTQMDEGKVQPAVIVDKFEEEEQQREVASIFNAVVHVDNEAEQIKAMKETLRKVMEASIEQKNENMDATDLQTLQDVLAKKRVLQTLDKTLQITLS